MIASLRQQGQSARAIARTLGCSASTVDRDLRRHAVAGIGHASTPAQKASRARRAAAWRWSSQKFATALPRMWISMLLRGTVVLAWRTNSRSGFACLLLLALFAGGCSTIRGTPERYQQTSTIVDSINLTAEEVASLAESADRSDRNRVQNRAVAVIDLRFNAFVRDLTADRANTSSAAAGTVLGTSAAGAFVDSVKAKTNYALFGAAVVGAFGIVDKNYFYDKTVPALVSAMRAARANVLLRIRRGQGETLENYTGVAALQDLEDYYAAGTLLAAIAEITTRAEADANAALTEVRELDVPTDTEMVNRRKISQAILGVTDSTRMDKGNQALKTLGLAPQSTPRETRAALTKALQPRTKERIALVEKALKGAGLLPP